MGAIHDLAESVTGEPATGFKRRLPQPIEGRARGELEGTGCWTFDEADGITIVRYDWRVATTKAWMNLLAPLARPLFAWNRDVVMAWGQAGLLRLLAAAAT